MARRDSGVSEVGEMLKKADAAVADAHAKLRSCILVQHDLQQVLEMWKKLDTTEKREESSVVLHPACGMKRPRINDGVLGSIPALSFVQPRAETRAETPKRNAPSIPREETISLHPAPKVDDAMWGKCLDADKEKEKELEAKKKAAKKQRAQAKKAEKESARVIILPAPSVIPVIPVNPVKRKMPHFDDDSDSESVTSDLV